MVESSESAQAQRVQEFIAAFQSLRSEVRKVIVGHDEVITHVLIGLFAGGHVLLEGVPGLGKTLLIKTLAESLDLTFSRIQFTPDLMPGDIIGTNMIVEDASGRKQFQFQRGPIFAQIVLTTLLVVHAIAYPDTVPVGWTGGSQLAAGLWESLYTGIDLSGWKLVSEQGNEECKLAGIIHPYEIVRVFSGIKQPGFSCGYEKPIWNDTEPDPAVLYDPDKNEVARFP
jgi:hypothetical protein